MEELDVIEAAREIPHPVTIVTVGDIDSGVVNGMTAAWVSRVSRDPPLVMVSISPERFTWELIQRYREFVLNIISTDVVRDAVDVFGSLSGRDVDKFRVSGRRFRRGLVVKAPVLEDALVVLECVVEKFVEAGDHYIVVGRVVKAYRNKLGKPTVLLKGSIRVVGEEVYRLG